MTPADLAARGLWVDWPQGFFRLGGDARLRECATDGCFQLVSIRMERGGIGSDYCEPCAAQVAAMIEVNE
jgi:hypothetical protein